MKGTLRIDMIKNKIIMNRTFMKAISDTTSEEYEHFQKIRKENPNMQIYLRKIKRNPNKKTYSGLTYDYMRKYIRTHESPETRAAAMYEFEEMICISECHSQRYKYPVIKAWFLDRYPEIANYGLETGIQKDDEEEYEGDVLLTMFSNAA